ncbi:MAG: binding-protein-dependent transport system inner rane component, partial [Hyphomicrobiales bacterium]|nr:binding-protein-dependent transport system inner rane component [Hyphomicrobiales bacterium]
MALLRYIAGRLVVYFLVVAFGLTVLFFVPRLGPTDPVEAMLAKVASQGAYMDAAQVDALRQSLADTFGLRGSLLDQYWAFIKRIVIAHDFGPSLSMYPTPVIELIMKALPWTFGLLLTSTLIAWVLGNFVGLLSGWRPEAKSSRLMEGIAICLY